MSTPITITKITSAVIDPVKDKETIRLGAGKEPNRRPITLPNKLDAQACLEILEKIHPEWTVESIRAANKQLDIAEIDDFLEYANFSLQDRMIFKSALSENNIIARGRKLS